MKEKCTVLLAVYDCDSEAIAIRQTLEWMGAMVLLKYIGRPNDFIELLSGEFGLTADYIILVGHGDEGGFIMPKLGEDLYEPDEPRGIISAEIIEKCLKLTDLTIVSTACTTGYPETAAVFTRYGNTYIAPRDYIDGNSDCFFIIRMFYELLARGKSLPEAFETACYTDEETGLYAIYHR